ncbi:g17965 [Pararge aegeria aegeria]|uniref:G17965 protein n=1 Tax=Pararge aegeria aegeria TaxID=348720 RepID=A0A8S4RH38_9NEOP|nr:g17965 [Pararge aegeria aegeria]
MEYSCKGQVQMEKYGGGFYRRWRSLRKLDSISTIKTSWGPKVLEWQPRTGKRSVGRPPTRWTDDIKRVAGSRWIQAAQNSGTWNSLQKTYVQQWTSIG